MLLLYGVLSDIHSNLDALSACVARLRARGADGWIVLGDTVGYGAQPNECLDLLRGLENLHMVSGNHDLAALGGMDLEWFNPIAAEAVRWTRERLSPENVDFLKSLPAKIEKGTFTAVHGSPRDPAEEYLLTPGQFLENVDHFKVSPCFIGHSHIPLYFELRGEEVIAEVVEGEGRFQKGAGACVLNPGSVGQPRDMDPRASCGLFDDASGEFEWHRVEYPIEKAQERIREAGLPEFLAERLALGR